MAVPVAAIAKFAGGNKKSGEGGILKKGGGLAKRTTQAGVSGVTALVQGIKAKKLRNQADAQMPDLVDPGQAAYLSELNQKRKSIDTGADFAAGMQQVDTTNAGTNDALVRNGGGDTGGTVQSLLQSERVADDSKNNVLAQGQQQQMQYNSMYGDLLGEIAGRKMNLQLMKSQQSRAEWAKMQGNASKNFMGFLAGGPGMGKQGDPSQAGNLPSAGGQEAVMGMPSALQNTGLNIPQKAAPSAQQSTFGSGTASQNPVVNSDVQQSTFGSTAGKSLNPDFLSNVRAGFKK